MSILKNYCILAEINLNNGLYKVRFNALYTLLYAFIFKSWKNIFKISLHIVCIYKIYMYICCIEI